MTVTETAPEPQVEVPQWEFKRHTPKGFNAPPTTASEALLQAQTVLLDEERWVKGEWFSNHHPEVDPDDPFCNDWQACAAGALITVTIGACRQLSKWDFEYNKEGAYVRTVCPIPKHFQKWGFNWDMDDGPPEGNGLYAQTHEYLRKGAVQATGRLWSSVPSFNDASETTRQDVIAAFSRAIALAVRDEVEQERENASVS